MGQQEPGALAPVGSIGRSAAAPSGDDPEDASTTVGVFGGMSTWRGRAMGWFWVLFWLIFLADPVWRLSHGTDRERLAAALIVLGGGVYVATTRVAIRALWVRPDPSRGPLPAVALFGGPAVMLALMIAGSRLVGEDAFTLLPYAAVILAMGLRPPVGIVVGALACVAVYALSWVTLGSPLAPGLLWSSILSATASGLGALAIQRNMAARVAEQDAAALRVQEVRNRMARDLHDILGHSLTVITMKAELASRLVDVDPVRARTQIEEVEQLSRNALADVRQAVSGYREISLAGELARARAALQDKGICAHLPGSVDEVDPDLRELFAWVVRETTTNAIRHSGAKNLHITLTRDEIRISDDGRGATAGPGNGLSGLAERAAAAGATLTTRNHHGFTVVVGIKETP